MELARAPSSLRVDLHCHSTVSDGTLAPAELAQRAAQQGVDLWALTDHDDISGLEQAAQAAAALHLPFVTGVEISVTHPFATLHVVGLGFDAHNAALLQGLERTRGGRVQRAREMAEQLQQSCGIEGLFEEAMQRAGSNPELVSRSHFARSLIARGICTSMSDVFRRYLSPGKPGFVPHQWALLPEAVRWIVDAGGLAVLAHPARYALTSAQIDALIDEFMALGGCGIEVVTGSHSASECLQFAAVARARGLLASCGSDFHGPGEGRTDLGALAPLPDGLTPIWSLLLGETRRTTPA